MAQNEPPYDQQLFHDEPGLYAELRRQRFQENKIKFARKYENLTGKTYTPNRSRYSLKRDLWLQNFAQIPREQRTQAQWRKFERYHKQIYNTLEEWGDYD